ncbi:hypothetical protein Hanom_Chr15g01373641 [Helianthus anomalus]
MLIGRTIRASTTTLSSIIIQPPNNIKTPLLRYVRKHIKPLASRFLVPFLLQLSVLVLHFSVIDSSYIIYGESLTKSILF